MEFIKFIYTEKKIPQLTKAKKIDLTIQKNTHMSKECVVNELLEAR